VRPERHFVLYWMTSQRRPAWNFALDHAIHLALELDRPLVVFEPLRVAYPHASDRLHRFVIEGMRANRNAFADAPVTYLPYVEPQIDAGKGLLARLAADACVVVADEYPCFFLPRMRAAAAQQIDVAMDVVDGCGILPLRDLPERDGHPREFGRAVDFRRHLQKTLHPHLSTFPAASPLDGAVLPPPIAIDEDVLARWPPADLDALLDGGIDDLPIDHTVAPIPDIPGGWQAAEIRLDDFMRERLPRYAEGRNSPDDDMSSGLSPYLHFGYVSPHRVLAAIAEQEDWSPDCVSPRATGSRAGWWNTSEGAEGFLDQLITWRELSFHASHLHWPEHASFERLPAWARTTLAEHADDVRDHTYDLATLAAGQTHDRVWNAAQNELRTTGRMHNYLRMLWGKRLLEWAKTANDALDVMIHLNDRYALDGRDPNSYGGILWVLGRHDRAWGPERPVFGKVRYMSSANTLRKLRLKEYLDRFAPDHDGPVTDS
jgi:deoxyribodipyrimidine photo-lyase